MKNMRTIILAAGKGTRMKSQLPKVLHKVCGKPILSYVLDLAKAIGSLKIYVVLGHQYDEVKKILSDDCIAVRQQKLLGTADAIKSVEKYLQSYCGDILILSGDAPLLQKATLKKIIERHKQSKAVCTFLTAVVHDSKGYGRVLRGDNQKVYAIREEKDAIGFEKDVAEINVGVYCMQAKELFKTLKQVRLNNKKKEFYLTDLIELFYNKRMRIETVEVSDAQEGLGINTRMDLAVAENVLRQRILKDLMLSGVTIVDPLTTYIHSDVKIGQDTIIRPCTFIENNVRIGKKCLIGPCARFRPGTRIANNVEIGNFTEVNASKLGSGVFMKHFSYLGDATVGKNANIGAGVVTANFDGKKKNFTKIGDHAFVGSDSILVAPISIGKKAVTGAGSVVTRNKNVPDYAVAVGVPAKIISKRTNL